MRRTGTPRGTSHHGTGTMALGAVGALAVLVGAVALAARPGVTLAVVAAALVVRETLRRGLPAVTAARRQPGVEAAPEP